jgi:imidazolonepropionase-like amidohydrolase
MVKAGMDNMAAIVASTRNAAELCDVSDTLGTVEIGKLADLVVIGKNPLENISHLRDLQLVFKEGQRVRDFRPVKA